MNLDKIKTIIDSGLPKELKEETILSIIADDEEALEIGLLTALKLIN